jgi:hypothetical protein
MLCENNIVPPSATVFSVQKDAVFDVYGDDDDLDEVWVCESPIEMMEQMMLYRLDGNSLDETRN